MTDLVGPSLAAFVVGRVQVDVWEKQFVANCPYLVSVSRKSSSESGLFVDYDLIGTTDIPAAILALKQAYDYMNQGNPVKQSISVNFEDAQTKERLP